MKYREVNYKEITDTQIKLIVGSCDHVDTDMLRGDLDVIAEQFIHDHYDQQTFPHAELEKRLSGIENAANRLALELNCSDSIELESILNTGLGKLGGTKIALITEQIRLLKQVAREAKEIQKKQKNTSANRHAGNPAFTKLLANIREIYMSHFSVWPGFAMKGGDATGKFLDFIRSVLLAINENLSDEVKESDIRISEVLTEKSANAIRATIKLCGKVEESNMK